MHKMTAKDGYIVLASDGLWDYLTKYEIATIIENNDLNKNSIVEKLFDEVMRRSAEKRSISVETLMSLPSGSDKRRIHDDLSIIVVDLRKQMLIKE